MAVRLMKSCDDRRQVVLCGDGRIGIEIQQIESEIHVAGYLQTTNRMRMQLANAVRNESLRNNVS